MRYTLSRLLIVIVLLICAAVSFSARSYQNKMAEAAEAFSALDFNRASQAYGEVAGEFDSWRLAEFVLSRWANEVEDNYHETKYWQKDYDHLREILYEAERDKDVGLSERTEFTATNALYRSVGSETDKKAVVKELAGIADRYKEVVDSDPDNLDAAFNYEYLTRLVEDVSQGKRKLPLNLAGEQMMHGMEGRPVDLEGADRINIFVPKGDEKKSDDKYGPGDAPRKKG